MRLPPSIADKVGGLASSMHVSHASFSVRGLVFVPSCGVLHS